MVRIGQPQTGAEIRPESSSWGGGDGERNSAMGRCHKGDDMRKRQKACGSAGAGGREEVGRELVCAPWWEELAGRTDFKSSHMKPT